MVQHSFFLEDKTSGCLREDDNGEGMTVTVVELFFLRSQMLRSTGIRSNLHPVTHLETIIVNLCATVAGADACHLHRRLHLQAYTPMSMMQKQCNNNLNVEALGPEPAGMSDD